MGETCSFWQFSVSDTVTAVIAAVGLFFIWRQLNLQNNQLRLQNYSEYTRRYAEIVLKLPEDVNSSEFELDGRKDYDSTMRLMRAFFDLCFEEWDLHNRNLIDDGDWNIWNSGISTAMDRPAFIQAWAKVTKTTRYGSKFDNFINALH